MEFGLDYKQEHNTTIIQHFEYLLTSFSEKEIDLQIDQSDQPMEMIQIIQNTINKMIIELSLFVSTNEKDSNELLSKKRFLVNKFFDIIANIIQSNPRILTQIQNIDVNILQKSGKYTIEAKDFTFLSDFLLTNLLLFAFKYLQDESEPVLKLLTCIQEDDIEFFISIFNFQFDLLTNYLYNVLKKQYSSSDFLRSNDSVLCLIILAQNADLLIKEESDLINFNLLLHDFISHLPNFNNTFEIKRCEEIILLHTEMNIQKLFIKESSQIDTNLAKLQLDVLSFFINLALKAKNIVFDEMTINFVKQAMELNENFDINSFLYNNEYAHQFLQQICSTLLIDPKEYEDTEQNEQKNTLYTEIDIKIRKSLLNLISVISISVDTLPDSLCDPFLDFVFNQFYCGSLISCSQTEESNGIKECAIITVANLTSITGRITDSIVSYKMFLEDIIETIDDQSFETKVHICVIFSNLLFENSQYFDSLIQRINIVDKLKPLIWSTIPSLHREVCTIFTNILMNIEDEGIATSISFDLKEEGIIETLSMMLNEDNSTSFDDKNYIFELSEALNQYLF